MLVFKSKYLRKEIKVKLLVFYANDRACVVKCRHAGLASLISLIVEISLFGVFLEPRHSLVTSSFIGMGCRLLSLLRP